MKLFPQPITSPSRMEKYSPTLMRSLKSNNGRSKSRSRSRLSPMFMIRTKKTVNETQEPSSPKVNCFGEVRVKRSTQTTNKKIVKKNRYDWIQKALFCKCSVGKPKLKKTRSVWEKWFVFLQVGCFHRKVEEIMEEESANNMEPRREEETEEYNDIDDEDTSIPARVFVSTSPPKNALFLMKSRSENYRPSSLANLFWGSPITTEDDLTEDKVEEEEQEQQEKRENPRSRKEPEIEENLGICEEIESSTIIKSTTLGDELAKLRRGSDLHRELRRSKSDPARISGELDFVNNYWKRRSSGFEEQYSHS